MLGLVLLHRLISRGRGKRCRHHYHYHYHYRYHLKYKLDLANRQWDHLLVYWPATDLSEAGHLLAVGRVYVMLILCCCVYYR